MENIKLLFTVLGIASSVIGVVAIFLKPLEHIKVYAAALGLCAAVAICLLPIRIAGPGGQENVECGSVFEPRRAVPADDNTPSGSTPSGLVNDGLRGIERDYIEKNCDAKSRETIYLALAIGIFFLIVLIEKITKARKAIGSNAGQAK